MIRATKYMGELVYNLKDICKELKVSYEDVISKFKLKNTVENIEYVYDENNDCWLSLCGMHVAFYNSNKKEEYLKLAKELR